MKETHRPTFRPRNVDASKPMNIIRDLAEFMKKEDSSSLIFGNQVSTELKLDTKAVIESEVKKICELFDKKKTIVIPKVESSANASTGEGKFTTLSLAYKQSEYQRPRHYIVYSEKNRLESQVKDYEATSIDLNFLKYENNFISVEKFEEIISALENDINKGEMIPNERVRDIILGLIPDKKQHVDKLTKYWHTRREEFKKSLVRKFWKDQKHTDKYIVTTFRTRKRDKMKTRRNNKNELEGLQKLREIRDSSQKYLTNIISWMKEREITKRNILLLQHMEFEAEASLYRGEKSNVEEKYKEFLKTLPKPKTQLYSPKRDDKENIACNKKETYPVILKNEAVERNISHEKTESSINVPEVPSKKPPATTKKIKIRPIEKITLPSYINDSFEKKKGSKKDEKIKLKYRIRMNKIGKLIIDKYVQSDNSFSPFDEDFNNSLNLFKNYNEDFEIKQKKRDDFYSLYESFLKSNIQKVILTDSEEDVTFNSNAFASSYKQFLKHKRNHPDLSI